MKTLLLTLGFSLLLVGATLASGGEFTDTTQRRLVPQSKVVVVAPPNDNTAAYVTAAGVILAAGIGYLGVRHTRKR